MESALYYRHSGRFSLAGLPFALVCGILAGSVLGALYAYAVLYIPIIYLNLLLTLGYGYAIGWVTAKAMTWLNVRNHNILRGGTVLVGMVCLYFVWVVWIYALLKKMDAPFPFTFLGLLRHPQAIWDWMRILNEIGVWSLGRSSTNNVTGILLWLVWIGEAALILGLAWVATRKVSFLPFCENCLRWCKSRAPSLQIAACPPGELKSRLEAKDFAFLEQLGQPAEGAYQWYRLDMHACEQCGETNTVTAKEITITQDNEGKMSTNEKLAIDKLLISANDVAALNALFDRWCVDATSDSEPVEPVESPETTG